MRQEYTTQAQVRMGFWETIPDMNRTAERKIKRARPLQDFRTDVRCAFVDYVDMLAKDNRMSEALASRVTLA